MTTNPSTAAEALHNSAMLATLSISQWTARKYDKKVSAEVEKQHQAKDAGRFNKMLVAKEHLDSITKIATACRSYHYKMTLPWGDNGERLLPATLFEEYTTSLRGYKNEFEQRVHEFVRDYPNLKADAIKRLGSMYDPLDYPATDDIKKRFDVAVQFFPVPVAADFRVNLNAEYVESIQRDIATSITSRQVEAMKHCWGRLKETVQHIHERLSESDKTFRDTLISNARELLAILPALNITNDPALAAAAREVEELLVPPERLREDIALRSEVARKADAILAKFSFGASPA